MKTFSGLHYLRQRQATIEMILMDANSASHWKLDPEQTVGNAWCDI
jgi:hypothetical protein